MEFYNQLSTNYLNGKTIYPELRRLVSLILKITIAFNLYVYCCGSIDYNKLHKLKDYVEFTISGEIFVPLSFLLFTHLVIWFFSNFLFHFITYFHVFKLKKGIINYEVTQEDKEIGSTLFKHAIIYGINPTATDKEIEAYFTQVKKIIQIESQDIKVIEKDFVDIKNKIEQNFHLAVLIIISCFFLVSTVDDFGWILFILNLLFGLILGIFSVYSFCVIEVLPTLLLKMKNIIDNSKDLDETKPNN